MLSEELDHVLDHLVRELLPNWATSCADRDDLVRAGLDPIGLVELVLRIEKMFGVELPDEVLDPTAPITRARIRAHLAALLGGSREHDHLAPTDETLW